MTIASFDDITNALESDSLPVARRIVPLRIDRRHFHHVPGGHHVHRGAAGRAVGGRGLVGGAGGAEAGQTEGKVGRATGEDVWSLVGLPSQEPQRVKERALA